MPNNKQINADLLIISWMQIKFHSVVNFLMCVDMFCLQSELTNLQWQDVQKRLIEVQKVHQMCVHKEELTELGWWPYKIIVLFKI